MHDDRITSFVFREREGNCAPLARSLARGNYKNYPLLSPLLNQDAEQSHTGLLDLLCGTHTLSHYIYTARSSQTFNTSRAPVAAKTCYFAAGLNLMRPGLYMYGMNLLHPHCGFEQFIARAIPHVYTSPAVAAFGSNTF